VDAEGGEDREGDEELHEPEPVAEHGFDSNFFTSGNRFADNARPMDSAYARLPSGVAQIAHRYGPRVHLLAHPALITLLARACSPTTRQPELSRLCGVLYQHLAMIVANAEFPRATARVPTRMADEHREGVYAGEVIDPATKVVCVDIARAGMMPSQTCFETFAALVRPENVRQDHIFMQRVTRNGRVTGADLAGSKIGGPVAGRILAVPDPMAATGSSMLRCLDHYDRRGRATKVIAVHLIVTPEYLARVTKARPDVSVYAIRLDRGLSRPEVLAAPPGERWREERGLNRRHYIVPGGGGFGELLNNADE
jgi:uracil phosphoribosyltransferase